MADKKQSKPKAEPKTPVVVQAKVRRDPPKKGPHNTTPEQRRRAAYYGNLWRTARQPQTPIMELTTGADGKPQLIEKGYQRVATKKEFFRPHAMQG